MVHVNTSSYVLDFCIMYDLMSKKQFSWTKPSPARCKDPIAAPYLMFAKSVKEMPDIYSMKLKFSEIKLSYDHHPSILALTCSITSATVILRGAINDW